MSADFTTIRAVGGMLPSDLLSRIVAGDKDLSGLTPKDYDLPSETPREAANRVWSYLFGVWTSYKGSLARLPEGDPAVGLTREKWLLVLFDQLGYGRVATTPAGGLHVGDRAFPVSHLWGRVPLHLLGWGVELDKRTKGVAGAAERAPHAMVQELLNRTDDYLWAVLSNGQTLRLLRDSSSLSGQSYVEFDLAAMFDGEVFSDFAVMFLLMHRSRTQILSSDGPAADCWLERWRTSSIASGTRALGLLREGVQSALEVLGTGFLQHPPNTDLRRRLEAKELSLEDYHRSLLRLVYRLLFLFVAEDRQALLTGDADPVAKSRYIDYFSTARLRALARKRRGTRHGDLWESLSLVIAALGNEQGCPDLGLPGIGGLFDGGPADMVTGVGLPNDALLTAVRSLSVVQPKGQPRRTVDYRNLGAEELGSIYESLLELVPRHDSSEQSFTLESLAGNERKTSGSYYTPTSLIDLVLNEALDPLLDNAESSDSPAEALLSLRICDPACGSGHFLVGAARRIADRLAVVRTGDVDPTPTDQQAAMHDVVANCIYGLDLNPMAAELAKVSLWLEALQPGRPLNFLDAHIKVGNALIGTTPALLAARIPDAAYAVIEGDDKQYAAALKKQNRLERDAEQQGLFDIQDVPGTNQQLREGLAKVGGTYPLSLADTHDAQHRYATYLASPDLTKQRLRADAWCAAFVQRKEVGAVAITEQSLRAIESDRVDDRLVEEVTGLAAQYHFFHWHLEFPDVFEVPVGGVPTPTGWRGGFTAILGNPPWERIAMEDKEFFTTRAPWVLEGPTTAARKKKIASLKGTHPDLYSEYCHELRESSCITHLVSNTNRFIHASVGRANTQSLFAELALQLQSPKGLAGLILPTGVIADVPMKDFWSWLVDSRRIRSIFDFENSKGIFPAVHKSTKFSLVTFTGPTTETPGSQQLTVAMYIRTVSELLDKSRRFMFPLDKLDIISPLTKQLPICNSQRDVDILIELIEHVSLNALTIRPWVGFTSEGFSQHYLTEPTTDSVALFEGKMIHQFDPAYATYGTVSGRGQKSGAPRRTSSQERRSATKAIPRFWAPRRLIDSFLSRKQNPNTWVLVVRDYARATDERTAISAALPMTVPIQPLNGYTVVASKEATTALGAINSFAYDFIARKKTPGQHFNVTTMSQIPIPQVSEVMHAWLRIRVLELSHVSEETSAFARDMGENGPPWLWDDGRRSLLRAELDAALFRLYGVERDDVDYILDAFPIVRRKDEARYGGYRTKKLILEIYDAMTEAEATGVAYQTVLDPPPGEGARHPARPAT